MKQLFKHITLILLIALSACNDRTEYRVDPEFEPYVTLFTAEAALRGYHFNFEQTGLIIEFADLKDNKAGLCHFEKPIRIEIDKSYWKAIGEYPGGNLLREHLIFHEMGHGILDRDHLNQLLPNGDWKSLMCGGERVDGKSWNINYADERRTYYLQELFDKNTAMPDFADPVFSADSSGFENVFFLSFDSESKSDAGWSMTDVISHKISIENKRLRFESKSEAAFFVLVRPAVDVLTDFIFELDMECHSNDINAQSGIVFGSNEAGNESLEYFSVNKRNSVFTGNKNMYSFRVELRPENVSKSGRQKFKVLNNNSKNYMFLNDKYIYNLSYTHNGNGNSFGFLVPPGATIWLDNLRVAIKNSGQSMRVSKSVELNTFEVFEEKVFFREIY
ncbi:MAG: hypothetical protein EOM47_05890 [Bacteroidia bacterium]|nr:hypothetical protein [Bacteroidia bacterium]